MTGAETLRAYWAAMGTNDFARAALFLAEDVTIDMPQSGERICGRDDFVAINATYPAEGPWHFTILSLVTEGDRVVTVTDVKGAEAAARAITFSKIDPQTGLIAAQTEYWPDPYDAPPWRAKYVQPMGSDHPMAMPRPK